MGHCRWNEIFVGVYLLSSYPQTLVGLRLLLTTYATKIDEFVCPPNISETVAVRIMKLTHRPRIASTTTTFNNYHICRGYQPSRYEVGVVHAELINYILSIVEI